jgi:two-component system, OmpR family, response regulator
MKILLIEDDLTLRQSLEQGLRERGYKLESGANLHEASHWWAVQAFDAVLLDLNLPDGSGLSLLAQRRRQGDKTPVMVLTARSRVDERIAGLDAGADDYLVKPFDLGELDARLRALLRRAQGENNLTHCGGLVLDRRAKQFYCLLPHAVAQLREQQGMAAMPMADWRQTEAELLNLPAREFEVLWELMSPPGRLVSKRMLAEKISTQDELLADNALEAFVSRLRKKLDGRGVQIRTLRGLGYRLELVHAASPSL